MSTLPVGWPSKQQPRWNRRVAAVDEQGERFGGSVCDVGEKALVLVLEAYVIVGGTFEEGPRLQKLSYPPKQ